MTCKTFEFISPERQKLRVDHYLAGQTTDLSRSKIKNAILNNCLTLNGKPVTDPTARTEEGIYRLDVQRVEQASLTQKNIKLDIIFEDDDLIVLNKQSGLTVHPGAGNHDDTLVNALLYHFGNNLSSINGADKAGIVHRLDRDTSGLMIIAKNDFAHMKLSEQLQERTLSRQYYALCYGKPQAEQGKIETYIDRSRADRTKMRVTKSSGRLAITNYEVMESFYDNVISLIKCKLYTGRTHQIRVHLTNIGHAILGDPVYGKAPQNIAKQIEPEVLNKISALGRQALQSFFIEFVHPRSGESMQFEIPLDNELKNICSSEVS